MWSARIHRRKDRDHQARAAGMHDRDHQNHCDERMSARPSTTASQEYRRRVQTSAPAKIAPSALKFLDLGDVIALSPPTDQLSGQCLFLCTSLACVVWPRSQTMPRLPSPFEGGRLLISRAACRRSPASVVVNLADVFGRAATCDA